MPLIHVDSLDDERLDPYARLTEAQLRSKLEPERALFIAESSKVIERAFEGGMTPMSLLMEEKWVESMTPLIERMERAHPDLAVLIAPHDELARLTGFGADPRWLAGRFAAPPCPRSPRSCATRAPYRRAREHHEPHQRRGRSSAPPQRLGGRHPGDPRPVTTCCTAAPCAYRWARCSKSVDAHRQRRGRNGRARPRRPRPYEGNTRHPRHHLGGTGIPLLRELGFTTAAMALSDESVPLDDPTLNAAEKVALVFGTEGDGLDPATIEACDCTVRIPMAHGVDSLNVAAASAVAFWQFRKLTKRT